MPIRSTFQRGLLGLATSLLLAACASTPGTPAAPAATVSEAKPAASTFPLDVTPDKGELPSLAQIYKPFFPVGIAITPGQVMMGGNDFIARQFSVVVAENAMKPASLNRAGAGKYDFANADAMVDFAVKNGIKVRGHALVWHQQAADWMFDGSGPGGMATREELTARMRTYIHDVVGHFKGRVYAWDVVNEAFVPDEGVDQVGGWRNSHWYKILGPDFISLAFQFAHEADPDALLFYNDYSTESPRKRALILDLVKSLQKKGVHIDGIGHQSHYSVSVPASWDGLEETIAEVSKLGLQNHITELDISMNPNVQRDAVTEITPEMEQLQAERYKSFFEMCLRQNKSVTAVVMWGLNDSVSWLRTWPFQRLDAPLLFDEDLEPKPAYWALVNLGRAAAKK